MINNLEVFGFQALWSPYFFLLIAAITVFYFLLIGKYRHRFAESETVTMRTKTYFVVSMILLYAFKGGPIDLLGHLTFSAHMTQMAVVYLAIPPLLILGLPNWLVRSVINSKVIKPLFNFFTKPLIALILFNGVFSFYHIPLIFDVVKTDVLLHAFVSALLFVAAFFMWWPLMNQLPEYETLTGVKKMGYIFADGVLLTPACALIIFADTPLYATYTDPEAWLTALALCVPPSMLASLGSIGPDMFNTLPPVEDQQLGGVIMKVIQEIVYGSILGYVFFKWAKQEREKDEIDIQQAGPAVHLNDEKDSVIGNN